MKYCFDLDGTLCTNTNGNYENATPYINRISLVNKLYEDGNLIHIDSARGSTTGIDWNNFTNLQLKSWGLKYHSLRTGVKIDADMFIDDKAIKDTLFFENEKNK